MTFYGSDPTSSIRIYDPATPGPSKAFRRGRKIREFRTVRGHVERIPVIITI